VQKTSQTGIIFDDENVIGWGDPQSFPHTLAEFLHCAPTLTHRTDHRIDQIVQILASKVKGLIRRAYDHSLAVLSFDPKTLDEILIHTAYRVGVDFASERQLPNAWQLISGFQFSGSDQKNDLLRELVADRDLAVLVDVDFHSSRVSPLASPEPGARPSQRLAASVARGSIKRIPVEA
jgi:hypothetical protein